MFKSKSAKIILGLLVYSFFMSVVAYNYFDKYSRECGTVKYNNYCPERDITDYGAER
jgi:hypothetical protein